MRSALAAALAAAALAAAAPPVPHMANFTLQFIHQQQSAFLRRDLKSVAVRDLAAAAYASFVMEPNATLALAMLDAVFDAQLPDGQFPWLFGDSGCTDANSVQFTSLPVLLAIASGYLPEVWVQGQLDGLTRAANASIAEAAFEAYPYYTNIYSMRAVNLLLFAQVTGNATIAAYADAAVTTWVSTLDGEGVREYDSPTYTAVALANVLGGIATVHNATAVALLRRALGYMQVDAAAHWFSPALGLGGAHSRDYDFLHGAAGMDWWALLSGLVGACDPAAGADASWVSTADGITMVHLYVDYLKGWLPALPAALAGVACGGKPGPAGGPLPAWRVVRATCSPWEGQVPAVNGTDRYTFASPVVTLGTSSSYYGAQDKLLLGALPSPADPARLPAGAPRLAQVTLVLDPFDAPYGLVKTPDRSGHMKPTHLRPGVATAADGAAALMLLDLTPQWVTDAPGTNYTSVGANVVLPAGAGVDGVYAGGARVANVTAGAPEVPLALGDAVGVRAGGGVLAWRLFAVDGIGGYAPAGGALKFDGPYDAARVVGYLYQGPPAAFHAAPPPTSRVGLLVAAGAADSDEEALAFLGAVQDVVLGSSLEGGVWSVTAAPPQAPARLRAAGGGGYPGLGSSLAASLSIARGEPTARSVNGTAMAMPPPGAVVMAFADGDIVVIRPGDY